MAQRLRPLLWLVVVLLICCVVPSYSSHDSELVPLQDLRSQKSSSSQPGSSSSGESTDDMIYRRSAALKGQTIAMNKNSIKSYNKIKRDQHAPETIPELADLKRDIANAQKSKSEQKHKEAAEDALKTAEVAQKASTRSRKDHEFAVALERKRAAFDLRILEEKKKFVESKKNLNQELTQKVLQQALFAREKLKAQRLTYQNAQNQWKEEKKKSRQRISEQAHALNMTKTESGHWVPTESSRLSNSTESSEHGEHSESSRFEHGEHAEHSEHGEFSHESSHLNSTSSAEHTRNSTRHQDHRSDRQFL